MKEPAQDWKCDPWTLTEINRFLYGNGISCGKGPLMCWFQIVLAFKRSEVEVPVNIKFVIESMHESGSQGLEPFLVVRKHDFFNNVSTIVVCESEWIGEKNPCLIYGSVGRMAGFTAGLLLLFVIALDNLG